jgi:hypothetical protein
MPLSSFNVRVAAQFSFTRPNTPFAEIEQGPNLMSFNQNGLDISVFNQAVTEILEIPPGHAVAVDLKELSNLVLEGFGFTRVLGILLLPTGAGSICNLAPGSVTSGQGLEWFFGSMHSSVNLPPDSCFLFSDAVLASQGSEGGDAALVTPTQKLLEISNLGSGDLTVQLLIWGSSE